MAGLKEALLFLAIFLGIAFYTDSRADSYLTLPITSHHFMNFVGGPNTFNEINPGIGFDDHIRKEWYSSWGLYYNSFNKLSFYWGAKYRSRYGGFYGGFMTGYPWADVSPAIVPYVALPVHRRISIEFPIGLTTIPTIALQLSIGI